MVAVLYKSKDDRTILKRVELDAGRMSIRDALDAAGILLGIPNAYDSCMAGISQIELEM